MLLRTKSDDSARVVDVQANPPMNSVIPIRHDGDIDSDDEPEIENPDD